ncbi:superoxide dismutase [Undibacter mobilis]|uniref:Superoxide dismutase n=1 Tax=Undibacter mobilis TaxID=2292256 RepID=A0A371B1Q9_9BRAD|nr:superoxide dismutase [Undibacter mobilis]RDV01391.1 superoxide dismutase [Undibacter mobilis]
MLAVNRRQTLKGVAATLVAATAFAPHRVFAQAADGPFKLPPLGYAYEALEPNIDAMTMTIHHQRHHGAFIGNLNNFAKTIPDLGTKPVEVVLADLASIPESSRTGVRNNLGGHWNHTFFWELMTPGGAKEPGGDLKAAIEAELGGFQKVKEQVTASGMGRFGSGWAWLTVDKDKKLKIVSTPNQDNPLMDGARGAIIGVDVWEHAYYLKYQNKRAEYLANWWNTVNWDKAAANYKKALA